MFFVGVGNLAADILGGGRGRIGNSDLPRYWLPLSILRILAPSRPSPVSYFILSYVSLGSSCEAPIWFWAEEMTSTKLNTQKYPRDRRSHAQSTPSRKPQELSHINDGRLANLRTHQQRIVTLLLLIFSRFCCILGLMSSRLSTFFSDHHPDLPYLTRTFNY